jgi:imidazolonepropionase-like amidohydrolase
MAGHSSLAAIQSRHRLLFLQEMVHDLQQAGVPLLAGTDAYGVPCVIPGYSLQRELELLQQSGLSPYEVLRTATVNAAAFLGRSNEFGQIAVGQRADLVLLPGNPLVDLKVLREPKGVAVRGRWLTSDQLKAMLSQLLSN